MSDEQKFLFQSDLNRFWEIVTNDDSKARFSALETIDDLLLCEVVRYGAFNNQEMIRPLASFYRGPIMQMSQDRRLAIYRHVAGFVENTSTVSVNAFLPFIAEDNARLLVSTAVIDYVSLGPLTDGDPMSRVKDIIGMIEGNMLKNEGAAFGALLHIGDKRVCNLLIPLRDSLDQDAMNNAVNSGTGFIHSATADFYLDWLEGMEGSDQDGAFGLVASGLGLLKRKSRIDQVSTGNRPFPVRDATPKQWKASQKPIPLAEYVQRVSRRMYALERSEPPPRVMPHVLTAWGLKPLTDPAEAAVLDDRVATTTARLESEIIPGGRIVDVKREWWDGEGNIFLTWGILNPNGPTLYVLGSREFDGKHRTFIRWLHMFGGCTTYAADTVNEITYQGIYEDAASIHEHLVQNHEHGLFHIIPSFLIANGGDEGLAAIAKRLLASGAAAKGEWGRPMAYSRQFGSDFFASVATEMREIYESMLAECRAKGEEPSEYLKFTELRYGHLPDFRDAKIPAWTETPMTPGLLEEWWRIVSPREFQIEALAALRAMWEGAPQMLPDEARANVVPWEAVIHFVEGYGLSLSKD
ncbi:MAG: hypothetical protein E5V49_13860 [Mesorhizobium sp.]|nr:MAG: hypothetical protein E5V48_07625 [Mesorhizobium sp.]TJW32064.1 MAG: hypothetical protein E5V49_13860 [Mesorhizobium sp.]